MKVLLAADYRRLLYIHPPKGVVATDRRRTGVERACREASVDPDVMFHHCSPSGEHHHVDAVEITGYYLRGACPVFDAVVCGNDHVAFIIYQFLLRRGLCIPQDVVVLDYDNMVGTGELSLPPLSTVQLPHYEVGRLSALYLVQGLDHRDTVRVDSPWLPRALI